MADTFTGKDKIKHLTVCLLAAIIHPLLSVGLALGKEYGDKNAKGNHWCWKDIVADTCGIILGSIIWYYLW